MQFSKDNFFQFTVHNSLLLFTPYNWNGNLTVNCHFTVNWLWSLKIKQNKGYLIYLIPAFKTGYSLPFDSLERRWSSRRFSYGYLVTTSPQLSTPPSAAGSLRLPHGLRVLPTLMVWRAVCTRPGNVFTATCWFAITSNSNFMQAGFSLQSELGAVFEICSSSRYCFSLFCPL